MCPEPRTLRLMHKQDHHVLEPVPALCVSERPTPTRRPCSTGQSVCLSQPSLSATRPPAQGGALVSGTAAHHGERRGAADTRAHMQSDFTHPDRLV